MVAKRVDAAGNSKPRRRPPATTPEGREAQLIGLAYDLVERKLLDGTATSQETTHFLKLGSQNTKLEREKLQYETKLLETRAKQIESGARMEELYSKAISAMREYSGQEPDEEDDYED